MNVIEAIMDFINGLLGKKGSGGGDKNDKVEKVEIIQPRMCVSSQKPVDGKGNDRDVWMMYKEV